MQSGRAESSEGNSEHEVGNFGLFSGNWGDRGTVVAGRQVRRRAVHDQALKANPAHNIVLCEATAGVEEVLTTPPVAATQSAAVAGVSNLQCRGTFEWRVQRGQEAESAVLIASRKDNTTGIALIGYTVVEDHRYVKQREEKMRDRGFWFA